MKTEKNDNEYQLNGDVPKHKKKAHRSVKKSKHKHLYEICLVKSITISKGTRCSICGKIGTYSFFEFEDADNGNFRKLLSKDEVLEKFKVLKIYDEKGNLIENPECE